MAIFRTKHDKDFTVMSNHHLRDPALSLKAKGLLSQMLALPADWTYSIAGLACINREGERAVRSAIHELEQSGYLRRKQRRGDAGKIIDTEYMVYEQPVCQNAAVGNPPPENPPLGKSAQTQINKEEQSTDKQNIDKGKGSAQADAPFSILSGDRRDWKAYERIVKDNIEYEHLIANSVVDKPLLDELVSIIVETVCTRSKTIRVAGAEYPAELVRGRFLKLDSSHIEYAAGCLRANVTDIRNIKQYSLFCKHKPRLKGKNRIEPEGGLSLAKFESGSKTDTQRESVARKIWLNYYNNYLYEHHLITEEEKRKMQRKIERLGGGLGR